MRGNRSSIRSRHIAGLPLLEAHISQAHDQGFCILPINWFPLNRRERFMRPFLRKIFFPKNIQYKNNLIYSIKNIIKYLFILFQGTF